MKNKQAIFETINPFKAILILAIPTIISQLIDVFYNIADTVFLGLTENPYMIASTGIAIGLFAIGIVISNLFGIGGGSLIARLMGIKENDRLKNVSAFSFYGSIVVAIIYSIFVLIFMKPLLQLMGASDLTYEYCRQYTSIVVVFGVPIVCASNTLAHMLRNVGLSTHAGVGLSIGGLLNIVLDPLFMFVLFPSGDEVIAAAWATLISNIVAVIYLIIVFILTRKKSLLSLNPKNLANIKKDEIKSLLVIGIPSALLVFLFIISQMVTLAVMADFGDLQVAAIGISLKVEKIAGAIGLGICQGMLPIVAYNHSSKNTARLSATLKAGFVIGLIATLVCSILFLILAKPIISLFMSGDSEEAVATVNYGSKFLKLRFLVPFLMFLNYYSSYSMQALNDGKKTFIHAITRIVVLYIPLIFLLSYLWQETGLALTFEISEFLAGLIGLLLLFFVLKKKDKEAKI